MMSCLIIPLVNNENQHPSISITDNEYVYIHRDRANVSGSGRLICKSQKMHVKVQAFCSITGSMDTTTSGFAVDKIRQSAMSISAEDEPSLGFEGYSRDLLMRNA